MLLAFASLTKTSMTEIRTAEAYLLTKLFEAEGEAEASTARLKEVEEAYNDLCAAVRSCNDADIPERLSRMVESQWNRLYTPDEIDEPVR